MYDALRADSQSESCRRSFTDWISSNPVVSASSCSANSDGNRIDLIRVFVGFSMFYVLLIKLYLAFDATGLSQDVKRC